MTANVTLKFNLCGVPPRNWLSITINGRQALHEGPRIVGHCAYCGGPCKGFTTECEARVFEENRMLGMGKP